jgi:hypothetical protein
MLWRHDPLTDEELWWNFHRACAFLVGAYEAAECTLASKPLAPAAGGSPHAGGVQFEDTTNPDYQVLVEWIDAALEEAP